MKKFIIYKKNNKIKHLKGYQFHEFMARDNGIDYFGQVIETGILQDKRAVIVECRDKKHLARIKDKLFGNTCIERDLKARECESRYLYQIKGLKNGD